MAEFARFNEKRYRDFLGEISARGLKIVISELDVLDIGAPSNIIRRDQVVADVYRCFLSAALDEPAVKAVVTWGLSNRYTWLNAKNDLAFARPDGLPTRPLLFDDAFQPTAAFDAVVKALKAAPLR